MATKSDELFAFVLMPFDTEFDDLYQLGIKEVAAKVASSRKISSSAEFVS